MIVAWENSRHFATPTTVSRRNDVWETSADIPYWWRVTTQIWVVFLIGRAACEICLTNEKHYQDLGTDASLVGLRSYLRRHFAGKLLLASRNVGCFLRLAWWAPVKISGLGRARGTRSALARPRNFPLRPKKPYRIGWLNLQLQPMSVTLTTLCSLCVPKTMPKKYLRAGNELC